MPLGQVEALTKSDRVQERTQCQWASGAERLQRARTVRPISWWGLPQPQGHSALAKGWSHRPAHKDSKVGFPNRSMKASFFS